MSLDYKTDAALQKRLHDELAVLVTLPNNNVCCDCGAITPKWASVNLGIFICIRCAGIHRSMGTHISKVRSITLDSWTEEQVEVMRKVGNANAKKIWENSANVQKKPDMEQHRLERFIRDKYERKRFYNEGMFNEVMSGKYRIASQSGASTPMSQNEGNQSMQQPQQSHQMNDGNSMGSKQLNFMPPSKFGTPKRGSQSVEQFDTFNSFNQFGSPSPSQQKPSYQMHSTQSPQPMQSPQQMKSSDVFDFGPDIEFQGSFETHQSTQTKPIPQSNPSPSGNVFDFLDASEVQTMPSQQPKAPQNVRPIQQHPQQNVQNPPQPKYQKKSDILFSQPTQPVSSGNIFDTMGGMGGMSPMGNTQQQTYDMTTKSFDYMSLYQQPQRQMQQGMQQQRYGQQGMQQGGMYNQMYGQQSYGQGMQQGGMQMPQRDYSSIGKYYV